MVWCSPGAIMTHHLSMSVVCQLGCHKQFVIIVTLGSVAFRLKLGWFLLAIFILMSIYLSLNLYQICTFSVISLIPLLNSEHYHTFYKSLKIQNTKYKLSLLKFLLFPRIHVLCHTFTFHLNQNNIDYHLTPPVFPHPTPYLPSYWLLYLYQHMAVTWRGGNAWVKW